MGFSFQAKGLKSEIQLDLLEDLGVEDEESSYASFEGKVSKIYWSDPTAGAIFSLKPIRGKNVYSNINGNKKLMSEPKIVYFEAIDADEVKEDVRLSVSGVWQEGDFGIEFKASSIAVLAVETDEEIKELLESGNFKLSKENLEQDIGKNIVLYSKKKEISLKKLLNDPSNLIRVPAVDKKRKEEKVIDGELVRPFSFLHLDIAKSWFFYVQTFKFAEALSRFGLNRGMGRKIFTYMRKNAGRLERFYPIFEGMSEPIQKVRKAWNGNWDETVDHELYLEFTEYFCKNPYVFCSVGGVGFKSIDKVALNLGIDENADIRIAAIIKHVIEEQCKKTSSTVQTQEEIFTTALAIQRMTKERFQEILKEELNKRTIIGRRLNLGFGEKAYFTTFNIFRDEYIIAKGIKKLLKSKIVVSEEAEKEIKQPRFPAEGKIQCDESQKVAILNAYKSPVSIITGGPGCGKTFSIRNLIYILDKYEAQIEPPSQKIVESKEEKDDFGAEDIFAEDDFDLEVEMDEEEIKELLASAEKEEETLLAEDNQFTHSKGVAPKRIILLAPTGRAAKRMEEMIEADPRLRNKRIKAKTIHRLIFPFFVKNYQGKIDHSWRSDSTFIIDESSMIDTSLMARFIQLLGENNRLVLVGDVDQLPPVGLGQVMKDLLACNEVSACRLTKVHRTEDGSVIPELVQRIKQKQAVSMSDKYETADYSFLQTTSDLETLEKIKEVISTLLKSGFKKSDIQLISPQQNGVVGWKSLNSQLRHLLNEGDKVLRESDTIPKKEFLEGDRVINTKNDYELDIFNGDVGIARDVELQNYNLSKFQFNMLGRNQVEIEGKASKAFELAYAYTVHKSQGSESPVIIMPVSRSHAFNMNNNLIYTGVSRAKSKVVLVGDLRTFQNGIRKKEDELRLSTLLQEIELYNEKEEDREKLIQEYSKKFEFLLPDDS